MNTVAPHQAIFTTREAATYLGRQPQTLRKWRVTGSGPRYVRMGAGYFARVGYRLADLEAWLTTRTFESTSAESVRASTSGPTSAA